MSEVNVLDTNVYVSDEEEKDEEQHVRDDDCRTAESTEGDESGGQSDQNNVDDEGMTKTNISNINDTSQSKKERDHREREMTERWEIPVDELHSSTRLVSSDNLSRHRRAHTDNSVRFDVSQQHSRTHSSSYYDDSTVDEHRDNNHHHAPSRTYAGDECVLRASFDEEDCKKERKSVSKVSAKEKSHSSNNDNNGKSSTSGKKLKKSKSFKKSNEDPDDNGIIAKQTAKVRKPDERKPDTRTNRLYNWICSKSLWCCSFGQKEKTDDNDEKRKKRKIKSFDRYYKSGVYVDYSSRPNSGSKDENNDSERSERPQYTIRSQRTDVGMRPFARLLATLGCLGSDDDYGTIKAYFNLNTPLLVYLNWSFRASFLTVFCSMLLLYFGFIMVFAGFMHQAGVAHPNCISVGGTPYVSQVMFIDAFNLAWTTFSTVGYGIVGAASSEMIALGDSNECGWLQFLCTMTAFVGVLYAGFCSAILFGKITRLQSKARVMFSDPILIRYGQGVEVPFDEDADLDSPDDDRKIKDSFNASNPFPTLEFRVVNKQFDQHAGEIVDASISCVASVDTKLGEVRMNRQSAPFGFGLDPSNHGGRRRESILSATSGQTSKPRNMIRTKRIFSELEIDSSHHPFFKRVWVVRHTLNERSPLLKKAIRQRIRLNGGEWPQDLNTPKNIRKALQFDEIIVTLTGTWNLSTGSVFAHKTYDYVDLNVGYQFVPILFRNERTDRLDLDLTLVNDIVEQDNGGGEPFDEE